MLILLVWQGESTLKCLNLRNYHDSRHIQISLGHTNPLNPADPSPKRTESTITTNIFS